MGIALGVSFVVVAFIPKALAVVLAIPGPVAAAYITVLLGLLFVVGMRIVIQDGIDYRKGLIAGVSFWIGVGFQNGVVFPEHVSGIAGGLLENGMTAGGMTAILLTLFVELTAPRRRRIQAPFEVASLPKIREFLQSFAARSGWGEAMAHRLDAAAEEAMLTLLRHDEEEEAGDDGRRKRRLLLTAHKEGGGAVLEFIAAPGEENLEDRIALIGEGTDDAPEREVSLRLLRHLASSVHHQQYHDTDIVTIRVDARAAGRG